jgi:phage-related protein
MVNLRKFGIRFGDLYEQLHEEEENEIEKKKKLELELMKKRLEIIQKYLMPHTGSTSILKDILSRY